MRANCHKGRETIAIHLTVDELAQMKDDPALVADMLKMAEVAASTFAGMLSAEPVADDGRCATCAHFADEAEGVLGEEEDDCPGEAPAAGFHTCRLFERLSWDYARDTDLSEVGAVVIGRDYMPPGRLLVRPSFGCTAWTAS